MNDKLGVNALRALSLDMISKSKSGHPGICLSLAPAVYTLYTRHVVADCTDPNWFDRDRVVWSCGHASALLYATLHLAGYAIPLDQLKEFRQVGSLTPGHPEVGRTPGVDATSGPLGQGIAQAVGFAMAEAHCRASLPGREKVCDHYTYVLCGDGCLEEGISQEAISFAGYNRLNRLILIYDKNDCTLDGPLSDSSVEDTALRFEAAGWNVLNVEDGNDVEELDRAIRLAKLAKEKPTLIISHTVIGYGSPYEGNHVSHGKAFSPEDVLKTKNKLGYPFPAFDIPYEAYKIFEDTFRKRGMETHAKKDQIKKQYFSKHADEEMEFEHLVSNDVSTYVFKQAPIYEKGFKQATRNSSQDLLNLVAEEVPSLIGGSADVAGSVMTNVSSFTDFSPRNPGGKNVKFGIREFLMASVQNGMLLHGGCRTYVGSFLVFADYMKPAIRMAAMERLPAVYLFSHDSIAVGEDGPTHQPIEQLTMLRTTPNVCVYRPADAIECAAAYNFAFSSTNHPTCIILSRQALPVNEGSSFDDALKGGYVVLPEESENYDLTILATGSEVSLSIEAVKILRTEGLDCRVVSMPCLEVFDRQSQSYKDEIFGKDRSRRVFIEMGKSDALYKYADTVIGIDRFGDSGPANLIMEEYGFSVSSIADKLRSIIESSCD